MPTPRFTGATRDVKRAAPTAAQSSGYKITDETVVVAPGGQYLVRGAVTRTRSPLSLRDGDVVSVLWRGGKPFMILNMTRRHGPGTDDPVPGESVVEELFIATDTESGKKDVFFRNFNQVTSLKIRPALPGDPVYVRWGRRADSFLVQTGTGGGPKYHVFLVGTGEGEKFVGRGVRKVILRKATAKLVRSYDPAGADGDFVVALPFIGRIGSPDFPNVDILGSSGTLATIMTTGYDPFGTMVFLVEGGVGGPLLDDELHVVVNVTIFYQPPPPEPLFANAHGAVVDLTTKTILKHTMVDDTGFPGNDGTLVWYQKGKAWGFAALDVFPSGVVRVVHSGFEQHRRNNTTCDLSAGCATIPRYSQPGLKGNVILKAGGPIVLLPLDVTVVQTNTCVATPSCHIVLSFAFGPNNIKFVNIVEWDQHRMVWHTFIAPEAEGFETPRPLFMTAWDKLDGGVFDLLSAGPTAQIGTIPATLAGGKIGFSAMRVRVLQPDFLYAAREPDRFFVDAWSRKDGAITTQLNCSAKVTPTVSLLNKLADQPKEFKERLSLRDFKKLRDLPSKPAFDTDFSSMSGLSVHAVNAVALGNNVIRSTRDGKVVPD